VRRPKAALVSAGYGPAIGRLFGFAWTEQAFVVIILCLDDVGHGCAFMDAEAQLAKYRAPFHSDRPLSRISLRFRWLIGAPFAAARRTSGTSGTPSPWPSKSSVKVTRDRAPSSIGSTVTVACGRRGPSMPWAAQPRGGSLRTIRWVITRSAPLTRRIVVNSASPIPEWELVDYLLGSRRSPIRNMPSSCGVEADATRSASSALGH
jgi:hypothetical protein